ncbi:Fe(3+) ABC transporter substrate-binding protein [filamentous cyanobacterium LEGE 11480]|uniref:Fe(3+) ABC transporter substrate-binding protein n=1 Tax=Romeriopsis navalis LEGE 11480 TaxID=2777977 RepID=A0A928Z2L6_9CYAN|nr:Fe(3+) ABC transporter substrate-binding protein [Romeriopsis navalis]MBE9028505.1 Fe(3+) ABC transporter substrate-binding protein [Romeriopsis navalis LEGE 11480]
MGITRRTFLTSGAAFSAVAAHELMGSRLGFARDKVVNLYSARHYPSDAKIYDGFFKQTGIKVNLVESKSKNLIERIKSEGSNSPADVLITVDAGNLWKAEEAGLMQSIDSDVLKDKIPESLRSSNGTWYGFTKRARILIYNKSSFDPTSIESYEDLAESRMKGKILIRSSSNIYNQSLIGSILAAHGEKDTEAWLKGFVDNFARKPQGNDTAQIRAVAAGLGDVAIANSYYVARLARSKKRKDREVYKRIGIIFPNQKGEHNRGTHVNISGAAVAKNSPNKEAAIQFLEYLTTLEAQEIFANSNNEYPVIPGAEKNSVLKGFGSFKQDKLNAEVFASNNQKALMLMDRVGWK